MDRGALEKLAEELGRLMKTVEDEGVEFWYARDLQAVLGYARWENFAKVIDKARVSCATSGLEVQDHFLEVTKMVQLGSGAERQIEDVALTRYACYLIAQNADPHKKPVAFAQSYFTLQTRRQELLAQRVAETERLIARKKLSSSENKLSQLIQERVANNYSFAMIRSRGDKALFGGRDTAAMKTLLSVPVNRPLADFLPTITIKAKDFANEITSFNVRRENLLKEDVIATEHVYSNSAVRDVLLKRGIVPEQLPAAEDVRKIERKLIAEGRKLTSRTAKLPKELAGQASGPEVHDEPDRESGV